MFLPVSNRIASHSGGASRVRSLFRDRAAQDMAWQAMGSGACAVSSTALPEEHLQKRSPKKFTGNMEKEKVVLSFDRGNEALICARLQQRLLMVSGPAKARRFSHCSNQAWRSSSRSS